MTVNETESTVGFHFGVKLFEQGMLDLEFCSALAADQVMVALFGYLVDQMSATHVGRTSQPVFGQEFQRAVDRWLGQTGDIKAGAFIDFGRRKMFVRMVQGVQDG